MSTTAVARTLPQQAEAEVLAGLTDLCSLALRGQCVCTFVCLQ
jgi:hypothetical protein